MLRRKDRELIQISPLRTLSQSDPNAPIVGQGYSARPSDPAAWSYRHCADPFMTASLLRADLIFGNDRRSGRLATLGHARRPWRADLRTGACAGHANPRRGAARRGEDPQDSRQLMRGALTVADLWRRYESEHLPRKKAKSIESNRRSGPIRRHFRELTNLQSTAKNGGENEGCGSQPRRSTGRRARS